MSLRATSRNLVQVPEAPVSGPYSSAAVWGELVWTSGALPTGVDGHVPEDFREQVRVALANLEASLNAAGADWSTVLSVKGYVADIHRLPEMNEIYGEVMLPHGAPARTTVQVAGFRGGVQVEFEAVAHRRDGGDSR